MNTALYAWSGIGDALMALPLLQGLKAGGHRASLAGNEFMRPFYRFLEETGACDAPFLYKSRTPSSWASRLRDLDFLLLPPDVGWKDHPSLAAFKALSAPARPILRAFLGLKDARFIPKARIKTRSSKAPETTNLALSYVRYLEEGFGLPFKEDFLFLPKEALARMQNEAAPALKEAGLAAKPYAAIYRATKGAARNMPEGLIQKIAAFCRSRDLRLVEVGGQGPDDPAARPDTLDWRGRLNFWQLSGVFNQSRMVFSIDGGLLHLALAARAKVCSFWGPTIPESIVFPAHPFHKPLCRYLPFQPYRGETPPPDAAMAFDFSNNDIARAAEELS